MIYPIRIQVLASAGEGNDPAQAPQDLRDFCDRMDAAAPVSVLKTGVEELDLVQMHQTAQLKVAAAGPLPAGYEISWNRVKGHTMNPEHPWEWIPTTQGTGLMYEVAGPGDITCNLFVQYDRT